MACTTVLVLAADSPLMSAQRTPLELNHATLVTSMAHTADAVVSLRMLDTGVACDVSGVMRVTRGAGGWGAEGGGEVEEREMLYFEGDGGGVRIFARGESSGRGRRTVRN